MGLRLENYQQVQSDMENKIRLVPTHLPGTCKLSDVSRLQQSEIESLEARLSISQRQLAASKKVAKVPPSTHREDWTQQTNRALREENSTLREENEELNAMVEMLKAQVSGRMGVVSDPRSSPFMGPTLNL